MENPILYSLASVIIVSLISFIGAISLAINKKKIHKDVVWFLGEVFDKSKVKVSEEHSSGKWVSFQKAMKMMMKTMRILKI